MSEDSGKVFYLFPRRKILHAFMNASSACAFRLLDAATFIEDELPNLKLSDEHQAAIIELCTSFAGTKHDVCSDLADMPRLYSWDFAGARLCISRIMDAITGDLLLMRATTDRLATDGAGPAYALLAESGTALLSALDLVKTAAVALRADIR